MRLLTATAMLLAAATAASASDFGTEDEATALVKKMSSIVQADGLDAAIEAMHDPNMPFSASRMGIHVFQQSIIVADNREPELIAQSYAELQDLTGDYMWPRIAAAADEASVAVLEWYHYDTEEEYSYTCHSDWATPDEVLIMVCR